MSVDTTDLHRVEARIAAVDAVGGIVHALWALSRAQQAQVDALAVDAGAYLDWVDDVVDRLAGGLGPASGADALRVVLGPQRSFCGGLPRDIARSLDAESRYGLVGERLAEAVDAERTGPRRVAFRIRGPSSVQDIEEVGEAVARQILTHAEGAAVELIYPGTDQRTLRRVVLLTGTHHGRAQRDFETYSSVERLLDLAVAESVAGRGRVGLAEALRSEIRARVMAAEHARDTVSKQRDELANAQRVLSQEGITNEICELVASRLR
jgi:F0F1-type ATP synthase gamma subunit